MIISIITHLSMFQFVVGDTLQYGKVQYFFQANVRGDTCTLALVSTYSPPDAALLQDSNKTIWAVQYLEDQGLEVIDAMSILSVVCVSPLPSRDGFLFVSEKLGLKSLLWWIWRTIWKHSIRRLQLHTSIHAIYQSTSAQQTCDQMQRAKTSKTSHPGAFGCATILSFGHLVFSELLYPVHVNGCARRDYIPFWTGTASKNTARARQYVFDVFLT